MGLLGDVDALSAAFDGTAFYSGASPYGIKVCDCISKRVYRCKCPRRFSDPDARWGWDSYRSQWFFGNTLFNVTAADSPYDLPIFLKMVQASRHDSITTVFALQDLRKLYPSLTLKSFIADGAMDNYPTYALLKHFEVTPFIALDAKSKARLDYPHPDIACFDDKGRPVCKGGVPFAYWGRCQHYRHKYRCCFKGLEPPADCRCSDSSYGKIIYIKVEHDPRLFPPVPRYSDAFKARFKIQNYC